MAVTVDLKRGDACPACGGELRAARVPTDEEFRRAFDKENPIALPAGCDTAHPRDRAELGDLHRCRECGYETRFEHEEADAAAASDAARGATKSRK